MRFLKLKYCCLFLVLGFVLPSPAYPIDSEIAAFYSSVGLDPTFSSATKLSKEDQRKLDLICNQKDCAWSLLKWHTSFEKAKELSLKTEKPILALRMLGDLREDLSCANSRLFRTILYSDPNISELLRENFVLFWSSERDVPTVEIRFPGGKNIRTTVTGNSVHYILDGQGQVVDALPGMTTPQLFQEFLHKVSKDKPDKMPIDSLVKYHRDNIISEILTTEFTQDSIGAGQANGGSWVRKIDDTASKSMMEEGFLLGALPDPRIEKLRDQLKRVASEEDFIILSSALNLKESVSPKIIYQASLSENTLLLVKLKLGRGDVRLDQVVTNLKRTLGIDAARNTLVLQTQFRMYLISANLRDFESVNKWVYDNLFLAIIRDPEMGLINPNIFMALDSNGII